MSDPKINEQAKATIERIKQLTEKMLASASTAGAGVLEAHQKALQGLAEVTPHEPAPAAFEWGQGLAEGDAEVIGGASSAYVTAGREARAEGPAGGAGRGRGQTDPDRNEA